MLLLMMRFGAYLLVAFESYSKIALPGTYCPLFGQIQCMVVRREMRGHRLT